MEAKNRRKLGQSNFDAVKDHHEFSGDNIDDDVTTAAIAARFEDELEEQRKLDEVMYSALNGETVATPSNFDIKDSRTQLFAAVLSARATTETPEEYASARDAAFAAIDPSANYSQILFNDLRQMDKERIRRLAAIIFARSLADTVEEYVEIRDQAYLNVVLLGDTYEKTLYDDLTAIFADPKRDELSARLGKLSSSLANEPEDDERDLPAPPGSMIDDEPMNPIEIRYRMGNF